MAVFTHITETQIQAHLAHYPLGALESFSGIGEGTQNTNYHVTTTTGRYILTLMEKDVTAADLPFCMGFMAHLGQKGLPVPAVIRDHDANVFRMLAGKPATLTGFLSGRSVTDITPEHCAQLGATLARMHKAVAGFSLHRDNPLYLEKWALCIAAADGRVETDILSPQIAELGFLRHALTCDLPANMPFGAVHADVFPDNVFFDKGQLSGLIDFYLSGHAFFAYDLMVALNAWCFGKKDAPDTQKTAALLYAYHRERPLSADEMSSLPVFGRAAALMIASGRMYDALNAAKDAQVTLRDPREHLDILRFHQQVENAAAYGFTP